MDLLVIPFHDWRKSEKEGFRTRDVHFIKALSKSTKVGKVLVINRPLTWLELLYKKHKKNLRGRQVLKVNSFRLTEVEENVFVTDYFSLDFLGQIQKKHSWFLEKFDDDDYAAFIEDCCKELGIESPYLISQNIFAHKLAVKIKAKNMLFDAWDNFLKFPAYDKVRPQLREGYQSISEHISNWITNSNENIAFYRENFKVENITLIKNGVKTNFASGKYKLPDDLKNIKRPIIGFGGKISYLINYDLVNHITKENSEASFVFVGQILDKHVYDSIEKRNNVFFLGDKKYDIYPDYVKSFDICIIPYNIKEGQHGGDSMKAYEYLLVGKKVVGTYGNGIEDLTDYVYAVENKEDFVKVLKSEENNKKPFQIELHSWESKAEKILNILEND